MGITVTLASSKVKVTVNNNRTFVLTYRTMIEHFSINVNSKIDILLFFYKNFLFLDYVLYKECHNIESLVTLMVSVLIQCYKAFLIYYSILFFSLFFGTIKNVLTFPFLSIFFMFCLTE